jgi:hypothetical protein
MKRVFFCRRPKQKHMAKQEFYRMLKNAHSDKRSYFIMCLVQDTLQSHTCHTAKYLWQKQDQ